MIQVVMQNKEEGCDYYRLWLPHKDFENCEFIQPENKEIPDLTGDVIIWHHKTYNVEVMKLARKQGQKVIVDFDDWILAPENHILKEHYNLNYIAWIEILKVADLIICTTERLAVELSKIHKPARIEIIPNALNESELPSLKHSNPDKEVTFGYTGGICHLPDIQELRGLAERLQVDFVTRNKYWFAIAGYYNIKGQTEEIRTEYLNILSANRKYNRVRLYPKIRATAWLEIYNYFDVSLIPLQDNLFNNCKSEIKLIESGYFKKAVICSNVLPYSTLLNDRNGLKIDNRFQWYKNVKYLIQNPNKVNDLGNELYLDVKKRFDLVKWNEVRKQIYESL